VQWQFRIRFNRLPADKADVETTPPPRPTNVTEIELFLSYALLLQTPPPSHAIDLHHFTPITAIMGYTDADKLAVNTIRLLSVSSLFQALLP